MDDYMSLALLSVNMHQQQAGQDLGVSVLKMAMDTVEGEAEQMLEELGNLSVDPNLGTAVDIMA